MGSKAGKIIKAIAPIAISFLAPELAPVLGITSTLGTAALGAGLGAAGGAIGGGGVKGALTGALSGGLGAGGSDLLAGATGLTGTGAQILSHGITGAATGLNSGGNLASVLTGGAIGAASGGISSLFGDGAGAAGAAADSGDDVWNHIDDVGQGGFGNAAAAAAGGGASSVSPSGGNLLSSSNIQNVLSGAGNAYAQDAARDQLVKSQQAGLDALKPFMNNGLNASNALSDYLGTSGNTGAANYGAGTTAFTGADLQNEPGYQFNLNQGTNALNNSLAAAGNLGSGAAIKAGQQFAQNLAGTTYQNAYARDLATKQQNIAALSGAAQPGLTAAGGTADINTNIGNANSAATGSIANTITGSLANILSGQGAKTIIGYKPDGSPIYA